jgi:hypothetical protein
MELRLASGLDSADLDKAIGPDVFATVDEGERRGLGFRDREFERETGSALWIDPAMKNGSLGPGSKSEGR